MTTPWLTLLVAIPVGVALVLQIVPRTWLVAIKALTIAAAAVSAGIVIFLVASLSSTATAAGALHLAFSERYDWIPKIGATYHVGIDGVSAWFLALNAGLFLLGAIVVSRRQTERLTFFCSLLLLAEAAVTGVLISADLLLFYVFWEAMLIPLYFLLSGYGDAHRGRAAIKFVVYTAAGSLFMLAGIIYIYILAGGRSFDLQDLMANASVMQDRLVLPLVNIATVTPYQLAFLAFALAFAIKIPLVPFHTWLPNLYESCPPAVLVFFAGVVGKLGVYGFIRYGLTLFPTQMRDFQWLLISLALLTLLYGALIALSESNIKRIVAYASLSHVGFIAVGVFVLNVSGVSGALLQVVNHGVIIAALFLVIGIIEQRTGTRDRHEIAGLEKTMPYLYVGFVIVTLAALGMPGTNAFAGEFVVMLGLFQVHWVLAAIAGVGVVLACWYMLRLHQGLMHDPVSTTAEKVKDLRVGEALVLIPLLALIVGLGLFPKPIIDVAHASIQQVVK